MKRVGIYDARAQLGELVRLAAKGETIVIEVRGKPMAALTRVASETDDAAAAVDWFVTQAKGRKPWRISPRELIVEGRRE